MATTYYFYDTETTGIRPSSARIMQFAGIRTNEKLQPIGDPDDILIKLSPDILPDPEAILVHGISPQTANQEGVTEADFCRYFQDKIAVQGTVFIGFNSVRFDDEFIRYTMYRNFFEPYEWQWKDNRSRWDLMDCLRMMRALRPDGIKWPDTAEGKHTVRLEMMTAVNGLNHENSHTALADVQATIDLAMFVRSKQTKLFDFLLGTRGKRDVAKLVEAGAPFVYTSGKYSNDFLKTTLVTMLLKHPRRDAAIVYDLRVDPTPFFAMSVDELATSWHAKYQSDTIKLPIKTLQYNRCPAIAPQEVLQISGTVERIGLDLAAAQRHHVLLLANPEFSARIAQALGILDEKQAAQQLETTDVDMQLYDSFWNDRDRALLETVRSHSPATLGELLPKLSSKRMQKLLPLYKARNYPEFLSPEEHDAYEIFRQEKLLGGNEQSAYAQFMKRLQQLAVERTSKRDQNLLIDLKLYAESIVPAID